MRKLTARLSNVVSKGAEAKRTAGQFVSTLGLIRAMYLYAVAIVLTMGKSQPTTTNVKTPELLNLLEILLDCKTLCGMSNQNMCHLNKYAKVDYSCLVDQ